MSRSPVKRGGPWKAKACAPTMMYSTLRALNNAQNSSKSGARSNELPPDDLNGGGNSVAATATGCVS